MSSILTRPEEQGARDAARARPGAALAAAFGALRTRVAGLLAGRVARHAGRPPPPLDLELTECFVRFHGVDEFEFALASRAEFPARRVRELMADGPQELEAAALRVRDAEQAFTRVLTRAVQDPALTGELFRELDLKLFSNDHGWREIMEGLVRLAPDFDPYKRVALIKYLQYLRARQTLMRSAFVEKVRDDDEAGLHATPAMHDAAAPDARTARLAGTRHGRDAAARAHGFRLLPKGEAVELHPRAGRPVELLLAGNRVRLHTGRQCYLVDDGANTYLLRAGPNLVGRHGDCDVVLDAACRAISRTHLVVEPLASGGVRLTDLSAHGTGVPAALLDIRVPLKTQ